MKAEDIQRKVEKYLTDTFDGRKLAEKCRDYYDSKQWTAEEDAILRRRKQAPITVNRVKPKVEGLLGIYNVRKSDPKAYPRTRKHEKSSHAMTDALRYVATNNDFDQVKLEVAENFFIEGVGGAIVDFSRRKNDVEIQIREIPWDRIYYDPHSRKKDFSDSSYFGIILWLYEDQILELFPDVDLDELNDQHQDETFEDRPRWVDSQTKRRRIAMHFEREKGVWKMAVISGNNFILEDQESAFLDEDGEPTCPIELVSANVDRNNQRYGEARTFLDQQDEINHRRSKFLHILSQRQTHARKGSVKDVPAMKREMAKPDGHVEWEGDKFGEDFGIIPTGEMGNAQFSLYQDAKRELDAISLNAQLSGERQGDLSGKAIDRLQQAGAIELNRQYALLSGWEKRIYRQVWGRIKQSWTEERWIRMTDNQDALRWVGFNAPITVQEFLQETINDESKPLQQRRQAAAVFQTWVAQQDPRLQQIVGVSNDVAELDMDIILEQSFDVINIQQEQFEMLAQFAQSSDVDIVDLIELSELRGKEQLIEKIQNRRQQQSTSQEEVEQGRMMKDKADMFKKAADADKSQAEADQTKLENQILAENPELANSINI